jgi:hypothetical protein
LFLPGFLRPDYQKKQLAQMLKNRCFSVNNQCFLFAFFPKNHYLGDRKRADEIQKNAAFLILINMKKGKKTGDPKWDS